jgi:hypothetical protein
MADKKSLLNLRISKKAYVFDTKHKYSHVKHYAVKKKAQQEPGEMLKSLFSKKAGGQKDAIAPQTPSAAAAAQMRAAPPAKKPTSTIGTMLRVAAGLILLFLLTVIWIVMTIGAGGLGGGESGPAFSGLVHYSIQDSRILTSGTEEMKKYQTYFLLDFQTENVSAFSISAKIYGEPVPAQVFVLKTPLERARIYPEFRTQLAKNVEKLGMSVNDIDYRNLGSIPGGSILIIPSGYMPSKLLGINSDYNFADLMQRGTTIIYIGLQFDEYMLDESGQPVKIPQGAFSKFGISFTKARPSSNGGLKFFDAQYVAGSSNRPNSYQFSSSSAFGSLSVLRSGRGYMVIMPQFLDNGWLEPMAGNAAEDVARLIEGEPWHSPIVSSQMLQRTDTNALGVVSLFAPPQDSTESFGKLFITTTDKGGVNMSLTRFVSVNKVQKGDLFLSRAETPLPTPVTGRSVRLSAVLSENSAQPTKLFLQAQKDGSVLLTQNLNPGESNPTLTYFPDFNADLQPGTYVLSTVDSSGRIYAASRLDIGDISIADESLDWRNGNYKFGIRDSAGRQVTANKIRVTMDGQYVKEAVATSSVLLQTGKEASRGPHEFLFEVGNLEKTLNKDYIVQVQFYERPEIIFLALLSLAIFGAGLYFRRPERVPFSLDIPDFPPLSNIKIPVRRSTVLDIFGAVNRDYAWKNMPLRLEEIKTGFRKLNYNGKPILVGDYNLERVLSVLEREGKVVSELGFYGLTTWLSESGRSMYYLAMYRRMRDIFVTNAARFSQIGSSPQYDVRAEIRSEAVFVHIYEGDESAKRALATAAQGRTFIIFRDDDAVEDFKKSLVATSRAAVVLKIEVQKGRILLFSLNGLAAYLKSMRG